MDMDSDPRRSDVVVIRDSDHYHARGDSVIRVENTLFKIHKFLLTHNSTVFDSMFDLPVGMDQPEGSSEEFPIVLEGDKAEDFRAVLKYLYAPPVQTQIQDITTAALPEIISVVTFAHKYAIDHWKEWGVKVLARLLDDINLVPAEHLCALYLHYRLVEDAPMGSRVIKRWCEIIEKENLPIIPILDAATARQDQDALAQAYCIQIRRWEEGANMFDPGLLQEDDLGQAHVRRILSGCASLSFSWSRMRSREPYPFQDAQCKGGWSMEKHEKVCIPYSRAQWMAAMADAERQYPFIAQMTARLSAFGQHLRQNTPEYSSSSPREADCLGSLIQQLNEHIPNDVHFLANHFFPKSPQVDTQ
ncbi:BTB domain-containing protein [Mycena sanguinolenta]|uniref:BTB domain-containing protein n=1 Tax=Mycena sanguinolenta TaxID=230812 RepID=A0A8H6ZAM7_9AGAR|nr:BTB domain-containing protein [Mycena sanguinolenta]